ncbi:MAG: hypothetical protein FJ095_01275 [Deltaproteobacteria bacterium]|nr:hypothetical protein [Deltaproteobacteria bacterium]
MRDAKGIQLLGSVLALVACNGVTRASDIEYYGDGGYGGTTSIGTGNLGTGGTSQATGASSGPGAQASSGSAGSSSVATASSTGQGTASSSVAASSSSGGGCVYPAGPYGVSDGKVIPPTLKWQGYLAGGEVQGTLTSKELFDCDASKGINAILFDTSQFGCGACSQEASSLPKLMQKWMPMGIRVVTLLVDAPNNGPPTLMGALQWKQQFGLVDVNVMSDPNFSMAFTQQVGTPLLTYVDPRTMKVTYTQQGYSGNYSGLEALAVKNGG